MKTRTWFTIIALLALTTGARAATEKVSGVVNVSTLADNAEVKLTNTTTLNLDVDKTLKCITGDYILHIKGAATLTIDAGNAHGIQTAQLITSGGGKLVVTLKDGSSKYPLNIMGNISLTGGTVEIKNGKYGIYSAKGDVKTYDCNISIEGCGKGGVQADEGNIAISGGTYHGADGGMNRWIVAQKGALDFSADVVVDKRYGVCLTAKERIVVTGSGSGENMMIDRIETDSYVKISGITNNKGYSQKKVQAKEEISITDCNYGSEGDSESFLYTESGGISISNSRIRSHHVEALSGDITLTGNNDFHTYYMRALNGNITIDGGEVVVNKTRNFGYADEETGIYAPEGAVKLRGSITVYTHYVNSKGVIYGKNGVTVMAPSVIKAPKDYTITSTGVLDNSTNAEASYVQIGLQSLTGTVTIDQTTAVVGSTLTYTLGGLVKQLKDEGKTVNTEWRRANYNGSDIVSTDEAYTVQLSDLGRDLFVSISVDGINGKLQSTGSRKVVKADCATAVVAPTLEVSNDQVRVTNPQENQEYTIMTQKKDVSNLTESDWANSKTFDSATQTIFYLGGTASTVNYVYTRVKEDDGHYAGTSVATTSIYLGTATYLQTIELTKMQYMEAARTVGAIEQDDLNAYYVQYGRVYRIGVKAIPSDASNFDGVLGSKWLINGYAQTSTYGTFYTDFKCTTVIDASTKYKTVYFKPANVKANYVTLRVEYTKGYNDVASDACMVNIGTSAGVYKVDNLSAGSVTIGKGEKQGGFSLTTRPAKATISSCIVTKNSGDGTAPVVAFDTASQTYSVDATNATTGTYTYSMLVNGGEAASSLTVEVTAPEVESVELQPSEITLEPGGSVQLSLQLFPTNAEATTVGWRELNSKVATVSDKGLVTVASDAPRGSTCTIQARVNGNSSLMASCIVTVPYLTPDLSFDEYAYELVMGEAFTEPALNNPANLLPVTYSSSNESVATVNATTGKVTIVGTGYATITASYAGDDDYEAGEASYLLWVHDEDEVFVVGDVNGDGSVTIADVTALVNIILGKDNGSTPLYNHVAADVNDDGAVTIADVTALVNLILGKTAPLSNVQLEYDVTVPKNMENVDIPLDEALLSAFQLTEAYVNENVLQNFSAAGPEKGKLMYFAYDTDGTTMVTQDYAPVTSYYQQQSYWYNASGVVETYNTDTSALNIGLTPAGFFVKAQTYVSTVGMKQTQKVGLQYNADGKIYTATVTLNITVAASGTTGSWVKK